MSRREYNQHSDPRRRPRRHRSEAMRFDPVRRNKYGAQRVQVDGIWFDSKAEAARYEELLILQRAGVITDLKLQPRWYFSLGKDYLKYPASKSGQRRRVQYRGDFAYIEKGALVVEDVKGFDTKESRLKRALMLLFHGIEVRIVK